METVYKKVFVTTAIDYANATIHIGHAYEKVLADAIARYYRAKKGENNVYFTTGTDEHGITNQQAAEKRGITPQEHVQDISSQDQAEIDSLNVSYTRFFRTTSEDHKHKAQEFFTKSMENGDIYKSAYKGLYCEGCEAYKTLSELTEDCKCPLHPTRQIQEYEEENYFFKWSKYEGFLKELIETNQLQILPGGRKKEMLAFIENGIQDIPISRPTYKLSWGIPVPNDPEQVIYVWFDALINYVTSGEANGFWDDDTYIIHFVGKDIARWHTLLWPTMLKSAGYRLPNTVYVHGFINLEGQKISKSRGNVIRPSELVEKYGTDAVRYYFLKHGPITEDVDISIKHFEEVYNADLANGLGNTTARLAKLAEKAKLSLDISPKFTLEIKDFRVDLAINELQQKLTELDKHINENTPWAIEDETKLKEVLTTEITQLVNIAENLKPFIPETVTKVQTTFLEGPIKAPEPLFPRIS